MPSLQRGHRAEHRLVALVPADPRAEDVLPDEHPDAVQPGAPELLGVVAVPASRVVQHVALLEPPRPQHAGDAAVGEPLRPREVVVVDARQREGRLALEADSRPRGVDGRAEAGQRLLHRVEEHAVRVEPADEIAGRRRVVVRLAPRADVPRVVVDEHADAALVEGGDELADPGHVAVEVELVPLVDPDQRVGVPEDDAVVAAELLDALVEEPVGREASRRVVVERLVPQPRERDREAAARPGELRPLVRRSVVADPLDRVRAPARQRRSPGRPVGGVVGRSEDLRAVELVERARGAGRRAAGRWGAATRGRAAARAAASRPGRFRDERERPPRELVDGRAVVARERGREATVERLDPASRDARPAGERAEHRADGRAVRVRVEPALHRRADPAREVAVEAVQRRGDERGVVDRVDPVVVAVRRLEPVDDVLPVLLRASSAAPAARSASARRLLAGTTESPISAHAALDSSASDAACTAAMNIAA